jgi:hypothetical protein
MYFIYKNHNTQYAFIEAILFLTNGGHVYLYRRRAKQRLNFIPHFLTHLIQLLIKQLYQKNCFFFADIFRLVYV